MSVAGIVCNNIAIMYGDATVAAMGVIGRLNMIPLFLIIGLAIGCQPLIGYSYGSGNIKRIKEIMKKSIFIGTIIGIFFVVLFLIFTKQLISVFSTDPEVLDKGIKIFRALMISLPFFAVQMVISNGIQAMGKAIPALILSVSRQGLIYIPMLFILNSLFGFYGFIYSQVITDILIAFVCVPLILSVLSTAEKFRAIKDV